MVCLGNKTVYRVTIVSDKMKIDIELKKLYRIMVYPYVQEKESVGGKEERYRQYSTNSLWEWDKFTHDDYVKIIAFLKGLEQEKLKDEKVEEDE